MKLLYSFLKDLQLSLKGFYIYIEIIMALIFVAVLIFVVPENSEPSITVYAHLDLEGPYQQLATESISRDGYDVVLLDTRAEVEAELAADRSSVGLSVSQDDGKIIYDYILQGYESEKFQNIIQTSIESGFAAEVVPHFCRGNCEGLDGALVLVQEDVGSDDEKPHERRVQREKNREDVEPI